MKDGLYIVDRNNIYAAFVVREGEVTICAPILRKNLEYYKQIAKYVPTEPLQGQPVVQVLEHGEVPGKPWNAPEGQYPPVLRTDSFGMPL